MKGNLNIGAIDFTFVQIPDVTYLLIYLSYCIY